MKLHFRKDLVKPSSELVIISPILKESFYSDNRLLEVINTGNDIVEYSEISDCDYVVLPYKWDKNNSKNIEIIQEAKHNNKKVLIFHIDDSDEIIDVENSVVFRTSFYNSTKKNYERAMPCFKEDFFDGIYLYNPKLSIGFCGQIITPVRQNIINVLKDSNIETDFIIRSVGWPGIEFGKTKEQVVEDFYQNMKNNLFNLCLRGGGNFSYRLYETLMMGRIPIIFDTDIVLPFEDIIDWSNHAVIVKDLNSLVNEIEKFYCEKNVLQVQKDNRNFWVEFLSPLGFVKNIKLLL